MKSRENQDIRSKLLTWLQPIICVLLLIMLVLVLWINPAGSFVRQAYSLLIVVLLLIDILAYGATLQKNYKLSSLLTVALALVGSWGAIFIDSQFGYTEFFPLIYITVPVLLSSLLLALPLTVLLAFLQQAALIVIVFNSPALLAKNWPSFIAFVFIASVLCIVANYISSYQLKQFKESSIRDHLTGLLNRRYFDVTLDYKIQRGASRGFTYGVMLMDIDNFKGFNDRYSHAIGDMILQRVASFLSDSLDRHAIVCRHGGDEFAIIIPDTNDKQLFELAEKLRTEIKELNITDICQPQEILSLSIGLALFPKNEITVVDLMDHADRNLMLAKELGKDRVMPQETLG